MSSIYAVQFKEEQYKVVKVGPVPGRGRAVGFFRKLKSHIHEIQSIELAEKAVNKIHKHLRNNFWYSIFQYIPFSEAREVSTLIHNIRFEIEQRKKNMSQSLIIEAEKNDSNPDEYFFVNKNLIELIKKSKTCTINSSEIPENQTYLYYCLDPSEYGKIIESPLATSHSKGQLLLKFIVDYREDNSLIKVSGNICDVWGDLSNSEEKSYENYKQEIFKSLKSYPYRIS